MIVAVSLAATVFVAAEPLTNRCLTKGRVGVIGNGLYVVASYDGNELILNGDTPWHGEAAGVSQRVLVVDGRVSASGLPAVAALRRTVVVWFSTNKIRFFDVARLKGGYYERVAEF